MHRYLRTAHVRRVAGLVAVGLGFAALPSSASASTVNLATASPFVVLSGSSVTNTGASELTGDLGVAPGTALTGFGSPAVVNGTTDDDNAVAVQAQQDATTAYNTAAGQPVPSGNVLTGQDLGGMTLTPGAYSFASSAQLTGTLTLDAEGNPNAQFVFEIGSTLTTASASSVVLINGASPCDVYWQVGSSATLGSATAFQGNVLANASITLNTDSSVDGRLLARSGAVTLDDNDVDNSMCTTSVGSTSPSGTSTTTTATPTSPTSSPSTSPGTTSSPGTSTSPTTSASATTPAPGATSTSPPRSASPTHSPAAGTASGNHAGHPKVASQNGSARLTPSASTSRHPKPCNDGFTAVVSGREIKRVVFTVNTKLLAIRIGSPFSAHVPPDFTGSSLLRARVTFKDATRPRTLSFRYATCLAAVVHPRPAASTFTG
jgi:hypothetical protein